MNRRWLGITAAAAALGATSVIWFFNLGSRVHHSRRKELKREVNRWEDEGGSVPEVKIHQSASQQT